MKRTLLAFGLAFALGTSAFAKTPKEVLEPYKAYRAAMAEKDNKSAVDNAYEAWQKAEELMGDSKTTGDLASNFADLEPWRLGDKSAKREVSKAYKRSIDLSKFHGELAVDIEAQRRTDFLAWDLQVRNVKAGKKYNIDALAEFLNRHDLMGSTYEGDMLSLKSQKEFYNQKWAAAEKYGRAAMDVYENSTDGTVSYFKYVVPIFYAKSLVEMDRLVDATLAYQNLMDALETDAGHDNQVSDVTYAEWLSLKERVMKEAADDPRAVDIIDYEIPSKRKALFAPLKRIPPRFPYDFLQGNYSGYVKVKFDVDIEGRVVNPVVIASTNRKLDRPALESLEKWQYAPGISGSDAQGIESTIRFILQDEKGRYLPVGKLRVY